MSLDAPLDPPVGAPAPLSFAPREYLDFLIEEKTRSFYEESRNIEAAIGVTTELVDGFPVQTIANRKVYTAFLAKGGMTAEEVKSHLAFEDSLPLDWILTNIRNNKSFLEGLISDCIELVPEHKAQLIDVPVGFAHTKLFDAGAIPVPFGGNVVLISTKIQMVRHWLASIAVICDLEPLKSRVSARVSYSQTQRLKLISLLPKLAQHITDAQPFPELLLLTQLILPILNEFEIQFAGQLVEQFIVLHEFGHIALRHTEQIRDFRKLGEAISDEEIQARLKFELEADRFAGHALRESSPEGMAFALDGFFSLLHFAEQSYQEGGTSLHPPASVRFQAANEAFIEQEAPGLLEMFLEKVNTLTEASRVLREEKNT